MRICLTALLEEQKCKEKYHSEMCETIMNAIFVHLLRYYEQNLVFPQDCKANWKKEYAKIFWYISENYRSVTLEELEDRFHYSRRQLIRIVQNATGKNFKDVIRDMKMERAKMLLRIPHCPWKESQWSVDTRMHPVLPEFSSKQWG